MRAGRFLLVLAVAVVFAGLTACGGGSGGGSSSGGNTPPPPANTNVVYTFSAPAPTAIATQIGSAAWTAGTVPGNNQFTVSIPSGTTTYGIAFMCPVAQFGTNRLTLENVIEANVSDGAALGVGCPVATSPATGTATGSADVSAIPGAQQFSIVGKGGASTLVPKTSGPFSAKLPTGTNDIAIAALNGENQVLAVKFVRSQTVPGVVNSGNVITLTASDETTPETVTVKNIPQNFGPPLVTGQYYTANGTSFSLSWSDTQYTAIPSAEQQSGDYYLIQGGAGSSSSGLTQIITTTSGGPITLTVPSQVSVPAPTPAAWPSFDINYSGFSSLAASGDSIALTWNPNANTVSDVELVATSAYLGGVTTVAVPDLTSLNGFLAAAPSGVAIIWNADAYGGTFQSFTLPVPTSSTLSYTGGGGTYIAP
jgi:hypothetical protein